MNKPVVGQVIYSLNVGNAARHREQKLTPVTVTKVGRKYFYAVKDGWDHTMATKYDLIDWREVTEYSADTKLYECIGAYRIDVERNGLIKAIESEFRHGLAMRLSIGQLREIARIAGINKKASNE